MVGVLDGRLARYEITSHSMARMKRTWGILDTSRTRSCKSSAHTRHIETKNQHWELVLNEKEKWWQTNLTKVPFSLRSACKSGCSLKTNNFFQLNPPSGIIRVWFYAKPLHHHWEHDFLTSPEASASNGWRITWSLSSTKINSCIGRSRVSKASTIEPVLDWPAHTHT